MNNRYLYRAKRTDNGEWAEGHLITDEQNRENHFIGYVFGTDDDEIPSDFDVVAVYQSTICQCTGLKDKNGKLIWENDIVHNGNYFVVKWNLSCARFDFALNNSHNIPVGRWEPMIIDWKNSDFKEYRNNIDFEVIGNIFDNPELLE